MSATRAARAAVAFLTRIPVGGAVDRAAVAAAAPVYPLVGAGLGAVAGLIAGAFDERLLGAALAVAFLAAVTGALHLDALADTADALGGWTREDRLRIMRDHAIGSYGAVALVLVLLVEVAAVASVEHPVAALAAVCACSRASMAPLGALLPYAREGESPAREFTLTGAVAGLTIAAVLAGLLGEPAVFAAAAIVATGAAAFFRRFLGGVTGDALGATAQVAEAVGIVVAVAVTFPG